ncbi:hypothetical protein [Paraburkholderia sp. BCC1886]|uniref:hypothetical protein n=1 Tax=Paraburkholderia sp. BCC1886 TaxID=2562670 RepID=UPI001182EB61|nr:hypothetical protein [Paraburkholderia sp. BCC1886]
MIEDKNTATEVVTLLYDANRSVNDAIKIVQANCSAEVFSTFRRGMADVIYTLFETAIVPICKQHPELIPEGETLD